MLRAAQDDPHATIEPVTIDSSTSASRAVALLGALDQHGGLASNRYAVERTLGEGGMGVVYLATQLALGRKVALKTVRDEATSDRSVTKLLQEAWLTGALEHPNIVPVYDVALDAKGNPLMVLKRIEGRTWGDLLTDPEQVERRFGVRDTLEWHLRTLMQVCNAVHFAHSRGVVHRDLKPENVMIGEFGEVYVVDWGIAVSLKDDLGGRLPLASASAGMAGTPCYMAPEMLSTDAGAVTERTDVYLLGAILHEILTGDAPHDGRELAEILRSVMRSEVELPESAPAELAAICRRALARDPGARFESAEALRLAIQDYLAHASSTALAREAERALAALVEGAAVTAADEAHRARLYDRLGECRFGFRAALQAWPENEPARQCLSHALEHMIAFELRRGDAQAAAVLLRELENPPESLQRRVTREVERKAAEERRLRALARAMDPNAGRGTKLVAGIFLGTFWTLAPIGLHLSTDGLETYSHTQALIADSAFLLIGLAVVAVGRGGLLRSVPNRRLTVFIASVLLIQVLTDVWGMVRGKSTLEVLELDSFLYFLASVAITALLTRFAFPLLVGYGAAWMVGAARPEWLPFAISGANLILTLNMVWVWRKPLGSTALEASRASVSDMAD